MPTPAQQRFGRPVSGWRLKLYAIIFESDTRAGRQFDIALLLLIVASVTVVILDSVQAMRSRFGTAFDIFEWGFTLLFTVEYLLRLACVARPLRYARSFFGVVDLVSVLPTYLAVVFPEAQSLIDIRLLRMLRMFRILKLGAYISEYHFLGEALVASRRKILVFLSVVIIAVVLMGTIMYVVEGPANGFTSIPTAVYWAITTMTTVGFGDITPKTDLGRFIASLMMLTGWGVLAVPTGIVTAELALQRTAQSRDAGGQACARCGNRQHVAGAKFCGECGVKLPVARPA